MLGLQNEREWKVSPRMLLQPAVAVQLRFATNAKPRGLKAVILEAFGQLCAEQVMGLRKRRSPRCT